MAFVVDILAIWLGVGVMYAKRRWLISLLPSFVPRLLWFVVVLVVLIVTEETINCIDYGDGRGCRMTPLINVILFAYVSGAACLAYWTGRARGVLGAVIILGIIWETVAGGLSTLGIGPFYLFMVVHVGMSYAFIALLPLELAAHQGQRAVGSKRS